jgi:hypothetical protein
MEEHRSTAGQGLGIAGLILGILAIPLGIFPCTFYMGLLFGLTGIILSLVALSQANRAYGPRSLIIAALVCSIVGLTFASVVGFTFTRGGVRFIKEIVRDGVPHDFEEFGRDAGDVLHDMEMDTSDFQTQPSSVWDEMSDTLKALESEEELPE